MKPTQFSVAHSSMLFWAVLIATSFFAAAEVGQAVDPILLTGLRLLFSAVLFIPLLRLQKNAPLTGGGLLAHALLGLLLATYFGALFEALRYTAAVNTAMLYTLVPLMTLGFEVLLLPNACVKSRLLPMVIAATGALLLILKGSNVNELPTRYPVLVFGIGCVAMALYSPLSQRFKGKSLRDRDPVAMTFWNMLFGALFLLVFCLFRGGWRSAALLQGRDLLWLVYLALFGTLATFWLLHRAIGVLAPSTVISYIYLSTLFVTLAHWIWLGQQPTLVEAVGALLVSVGMLMLLNNGRQMKAVTA